MKKAPRLWKSLESSRQRRRISPVLRYSFAFNRLNNLCSAKTSVSMSKSSRIETWAQFKFTPGGPFCLNVVHLALPPAALVPSHWDMALAFHKVFRPILAACGGRSPACWCRQKVVLDMPSIARKVSWSTSSKSAAIFVTSRFPGLFAGPMQLGDTANKMRAESREMSRNPLIPSEKIILGALEERQINQMPDICRGFYGAMMAIKKPWGINPRASVFKLWRPLCGHCPGPRTPFKFFPPHHPPVDNCAPQRCLAHCLWTHP